MSDKVKKARLRLDKAEQKYEKAQAKIPKKRVKQRLYEKDAPPSKLSFDEIKPKPSTKLVDKPRPPSKTEYRIKNAPQRQLRETFHKEIAKNEDDNVGVKTAHSVERSAEFVGDRAKSAYHSHKLKPYKNLDKAEKALQKSQVNFAYRQKLAQNPQIQSNPLSRWQQKRAIKQQYAKAYRTGAKGATTGATKTASTVKATAKKGADAVTKAITAVAKNPKVLLVIGAIVLVIVIIGGIVSSTSVLFGGTANSLVSTSYTSENDDIITADNNYYALENSLQWQVDNIENDYPGYDEYRYNLDSIAHSSHDLAAYLSALLVYYTPSEVQGELQRIFEKQYKLTLNSEVETRYRTETRTRTVTDDEGNTSTEEYEVEVAYDYYILNVTLTNTPINNFAPSLLTAEQKEIYNALLITKGNKPLLFGGGSFDGSPGTDISGVIFVDGERPGNQAIVDIALSQVGNVGGQPYWSWYGFNYRVEWCATFVSWAFNQAGYSEPKFAACQSQGIPYFSSVGRFAGRGYEHIAPGDAIFFDWEGDGSADHVGIVIGTDGSRVYTVEGNSGDACKVRDYALDSSVIAGYGLMN